MEAGDYIIDVLHKGQHVAGSPFKVTIGEADLASKVKIYGPGVEEGATGEANKFFANMKEAGEM